MLGIAYAGVQAVGYGAFLLENSKKFVTFLGKAMGNGIYKVFGIAYLKIFFNYRANNFR